MDIHSPNADALLGMLLFGAILAVVTLGFLIMHNTQVSVLSPDNGFNKLLHWLSRDSVTFLWTLAVSLTALLSPILRFGPSDLLSYLSALRGVSSFGWFFTIVAAFHAIAPLMVGICLLIGRRQRHQRFEIEISFS